MGAQKERSYNTWPDEATVQGSSHAKREECRGGSGRERRVGARRDGELRSRWVQQSASPDAKELT